MSSAAAFSDRVREAIYNAGDHRCIGCGRTDISAQHRRARGMGGSRRPELGQPANGVPLCGHGTAGCHGWTEHHPLEAALLGWRLEHGHDPYDEPFWTRFGWRRWTVIDGMHVVAYVDDTDIPNPTDRDVALSVYDNRSTSWR